MNIASRLETPFLTQPAPGEALEISAGVKWVSMRMPFRLNHVNCWLMADNGGWSIVDCGLDDDATRGAWHRVRGQHVRGAAIRRVVATHGHTDHVGAAGFLCAEFDAVFTSTLTEWQSAQLRRVTYQERGVELEAFLRMTGCGSELETAFSAERARVARYLGPLPGALDRMRHGRNLSIDGENWRIICTAGHADEQACLYNDERRILIAGDQLLPGITPVVAVFHSAPDEDPLADFLRSLEDLSTLPDDVLVLPGHGRPFYGLRSRIRSTVEHHEQRLAAVSDLLRTPRTVLDVSRALFPTAREGGQERLALGETLAHINHLLGKGEVSYETRPDGSRLYHGT